MIMMNDDLVVVVMVYYTLPLLFAFYWRLLPRKTANMRSLSLRKSADGPLAFSILYSSAKMNNVMIQKVFFSSSVTSLQAVDFSGDLSRLKGAHSRNILWIYSRSYINRLLSQDRSASYPRQVTTSTRSLFVYNRMPVSYSEIIHSPLTFPYILSIMSRWFHLSRTPCVFAMRIAAFRCFRTYALLTLHSPKGIDELFGILQEQRWLVAYCLVSSSRSATLSVDWNWKSVIGRHSTGSIPFVPTPM